MAACQKFVFFVIFCVCPITITLGQMVEEVGALRSVKDVNLINIYFIFLLKKLEYIFFGTLGIKHFTSQ